ncbi:Uncharacterised protein [Pannonibacter phragmitetus]|uniref:Uncharacterized protein n=1 Tax=Pannonibacter phragmitetus TaxID=121719 RepID=A0A378ZUG7_9HYPH|nr:hypothetical protein [Pannonibacter phragmitetus]SUB00837.1 Uncharacterised protein [Pannonibacter phragmitetus]
MSAEFREYLINRDDGPDLRFTGRRIATAESSPDRQSCDYSGQIGCWDELELYQTNAGNFVCVIENCYAGHRNERRAVVANDASEVIDFFGQNWLAKILYGEAGIENVQDVA